MKVVSIFCDGSAIGNPGPGGWGAVLSDRARVKEIGGSDTHTTNNGMELTAAIQALQHIKTRAEITINTDSQYVIQGITKWVFGWEKNGWQTKEKKEVLNRDLWEELFLCSKKHEVTWNHVRGHEGVALNERADVIANGFARKEKVELYFGSLAKYKAFLTTMPKARTVASSKSKKGKAYSYVSVIEGKVVVHASWGECEARVKGKKARYKKVFSKQEEDELVRSWRT